MAFISPQLQIDQQQQDRANANYKAIGDSIIGSINGMEENRQRALAEKRQKDQTSLALSQAGANSAEINDYQSTGNLNPILERNSKIAEASRLKAISDSELERRVKESTINKNNKYGQVGAAKMSDQEKIDYRFKKKKEERDSEGSRPLPDFEVTPGVKLEDKDREVLKSQNTAVKNVSLVGKRLIDNIGKHGITSGSGVTQGDRAVTQDLVDLQLQMKELFNLGVLNGPDLDLLNKNLGNLQGPVDMMNPFNSRENAQKQVQNVIDSAINKLSNTAQARGANYTGARPGDDAAKMNRLNELRAKKAASMQQGQN